MLKKLFILFVIGIILVMSGCQNDSGKSQDNVTSSPKPTTPLTSEPVKKPMGIRKVTWGMDIEKVKRLESKNDLFVDRDDTLLYLNQKVSDLSCQLFYLFNTKKQLMGAFYVIKEDFSDANRYIEEYEKMVKSLTDMYGEPDTSEVNRKDGTENADESTLGNELLAGNLGYYNFWRRENVQFSASLYTSGEIIMFIISYTDDSLDNT